MLDVYANSKQVMRFLNSGITSYMLFNMNAGASVSSTLTFKNGSGITSEKTGANPRNGRIYWGGDASRGNRIEFADDAGWKAYIERHPSNGVQLVVNGRINGSIVYSSGEVLAGGGSARFAADGNIFGSKWGNQWLDAYLKIPISQRAIIPRQVRPIPKQNRKRVMGSVKRRQVITVLTTRTATVLCLCSL